LDQAFEKIWQTRLKSSLENELGRPTARRVLDAAGSVSPDRQTEWTRRVLSEITCTAGPRSCRAVLAACACRYPSERLAPIRQAYAATGDLELAHGMLQEQYLGFLRGELGLGPEVVETVVAYGWGLAGKLNGTVVGAVKMPKSENLLPYLGAEDPERRRQLYCHCPRTRQALLTGERLPVDYCYCGAGFYKALWEEILGRLVAVRVLSSVVAGDDACRIEIDLSPGSAGPEGRRSESRVSGGSEAWSGN